MATKTAVKRKAAPAKSAPAVRKPATAKAAPAKEEKKHKKDKKAENKTKVVRDSFTMPQSDYAKIAELKQACHKAGIQVKKSELLRAGLHALAKLGTAQLKQTIAQMEQIKTGRPKKAS